MEKEIVKLTPEERRKLVEKPLPTLNIIKNSYFQAGNCFVDGGKDFSIGVTISGKE